jgi:hypothetical protein
VSTAAVEALAMAVLAGLWVLVTVLAVRSGRRTGRKSQWRVVAPLAAAFCLALLVLNLKGYVFSGPGLDVRPPDR